MYGGDDQNDIGYRRRRRRRVLYTQFRQNFKIYYAYPFSPSFLNSLGFFYPTKKITFVAHSRIRIAPASWLCDCAAPPTAPTERVYSGFKGSFLYRTGSIPGNKIIFYTDYNPPNPPYTSFTMTITARIYW